MADKLIEKLELVPYPGKTSLYFRETYRSEFKVKPLSDERDQRCFLTTIYLLATRGELGGWHRLKSDESFYYHRGRSLRIAIIDPKGKLNFVTVGDTSKDEDAVFHYTVPANSWFNYVLADTGDEEYGLFAVGVSPGFDIADMQLKDSAQLAEEFPQYKKVIEEFTSTLE